jgi:hypothetical protein
VLLLLLLLLLRCSDQVLRIVTLAGANDKGGFFPNGVNGRINTTAGYTDAANGFGGYPGNQVRSTHVYESVEQQQLAWCWPQHAQFNCR